MNPTSTEPADHNDRDVALHSGTAHMRGRLFVWHEKPGGEIVFRQEDGGQVSLSELSLPEDMTLALVNHLLAHYRSHAIGCENKYYAAAAGITTDGRLYLSTNNMMHIEDKFYRGCAETPLLRKVQDALGDVGVDFSAVYLMSGIADKAPGGLKDKESGHVACMCGECRANLRAHTKSARFFMIPTNNGSADLTVNTTANTTSELKPGQVWEISHEKMYPLPRHKTLDALHNHIVRDGYYHIIDEMRPALPLDTSLSKLDVKEHDGNVTISVADFLKLKKAYEHPDFSLSALNDHPTQVNINRAMVQFMKKAYAAHAEKMPADKNIEISVIIIKTNKGEFFPGVLVDGELWLPSKPSEMPVALSNAYNQIGISDVYMMTFNDRQIRGELSAWNGGSKEGHSVKMPSPAALGRLIKNLKESDNPVMHVLPVNDGQLSEGEINDMKFDLSVRDAFGPGYTNPKRTNGHTQHH